jgi:hypothetical protein
VLYDASTRTLLETVAPGLIRSDGTALTDAHVEALATYLGGSVPDGAVERVALVFMMEEEGQRFLDVCKRYGVGCRAFSMATGTEQTLFEGNRVAQRSGTATGPLLPIIREAAWPHVATTVHRRLFKTIDQGPWLTFARDEGSALARLPVDELQKRSLEAIEAEALENLAKRSFTITKSGNAAQLLDEYAPESLLLPRICAELCSVVDSKLCLVATREGMLLAGEVTNVNLIVVADKMFRDGNGRRVAPMPLLISAEGLQGFASATPEATSSPPSKPWWRFW